MNNRIKIILSIWFAIALAVSVVPFNIFASGPNCGSDMPPSSKRCALQQRCVVCGRRPERIVKVKNSQGDVSYVCPYCFDDRDDDDDDYYYNEFIKCINRTCDNFINKPTCYMNDGYCDDCAKMVNHYHVREAIDAYDDPENKEIGNIREQIVYPIRVACVWCWYRPNAINITYYNNCNHKNGLYFCNKGDAIFCDDCCDYDQAIVVPCAEDGCEWSIDLQKYFIDKGRCFLHRNNANLRGRVEQFDNGKLDEEYQAFIEHANGVVYKKIKNDRNAINALIKARGAEYPVNRQEIYNTLFPNDNYADEIVNDTPNIDYDDISDDSLHI